MTDRLERRWQVLVVEIRVVALEPEKMDKRRGLQSGRCAGA